MEIDYSINSHKRPCPRVDCRKEACICGLKYVSIPSVLGDDTPESGVAPKKGEYCNAIVKYETNDHIYVYSKEGIPTLVEEGNISKKLEKEIEDRIAADEALQDEIDELKNSPDVVDIVATYEDLMDYDTSKLGDNDVVRVLTDETHDDESSYYRWDKTNSQWVFIGAIEGYYTKDQTDNLLNGKQDKLTAGSNINIDADNVISGAYMHFTGATASTDGVQGLVPGPLAGDENKFLKADGTWDAAGSNYTAGNGVDITNGVISVTNTGKPIELTSADYNWPTTGTKTDIAAWLLPDGYYHVSENNVSVKWNTSEGDVSPTFIKGTSPSNNDALIIKWNGWTASTYATNANGGRRATGTFVNMQDVKDSLTSTSVVYPLSANQGRVLKNLIDGLIISGAGAPTNTTVGVVGTLYEDTTNGELYQCTAIDTTDPQNPVYTWDAVGGGPTVVQNTGTSTTDVMSQNAVTSMVFASPSDETQIQIGAGAKSTGTRSISIFNDASASSSWGKSSGIGTINLGAKAAGGARGIAIGEGAEVTNSSTFGIALGGGGATASGVGAVALGSYSNAASKGEMNIGSSNTSYGYNSSNYRLLTGVYDGQSLHDAATVAQGNTLATTAPTTSTVGVLGQLYTDTTNMHTYQCTAISGNTYTWTQRW